MAYTQSAFVSQITIDYENDAVPDSIAWRYRNTDGEWVWTSAPKRSAGATWATADGELQALQLLHASPNGIRDANGDRTPIYMAGFPDEGVTTVDALEGLGYFNPMAWQGWGRYVNHRRTLGIVQARATPATDGGTVEVQAGIHVKPRLVSGGPVVLTNWTVVARPTRANGREAFMLRLDVPEHQPVTQANAHEYGPIAAMVSWLNGRKTHGADITGSLAAGADGWGTGDPRRWRISHTTGSPAYEISFWITASYFPGARLRRLELYGEVIPGDVTYTPDHLAAAIRRIPPVIVDTSVYEEHDLGIHESPLRGSRVELTDGSTLDSAAGVPRWHVQGQGAAVPRIVPVGSHGIVDFADLGAVLQNGAEAYRVMPTQEEAPLAGEIHHYGTPRAALRLLKPSVVNGYSGVVFPYKVDNQGPGLLDVQYWDGENLATLQPNQSADLRFVTDREGGSRLLGSVSTRVHELTHGTESYLWPGRTYSFSGTEWIMMARTPTEVDYIDADAFAIGTATPAADQSAYDAATIPVSAEALTARKAGLLDFEQAITIRSDATSGNTPAGHRTALLIRHGTTVQLVPVASYDVYSAGGVPRTYVWRWRGRVEAGTHLFPWLIFSKTGTLNFSASNIESFVRTATLEQEIAREEAA